MGLRTFDLGIVLDTVVGLEGVNLVAFHNHYLDKGLSHHCKASTAPSKAVVDSHRTTVAGQADSHGGYCHSYHEIEIVSDALSRPHVRSKKHTTSSVGGICSMERPNCSIVQVGNQIACSSSLAVAIAVESFHMGSVEKKS